MNDGVMNSKFRENIVHVQFFLFSTETVVNVLLNLIWDDIYGYFKEG